MPPTAERLLDKWAIEDRTSLDITTIYPEDEGRNIPGTGSCRRAQSRLTRIGRCEMAAEPRRGRRDPESDDDEITGDRAALKKGGSNSPPSSSDRRRAGAAPHARGRFRTLSRMPPHRAMADVPRN